MSFVKIIIHSFLIVLILVSSSFSDDIGLLTIKNKFQSQVISQILPYAYTRFENKFLVSFNDSQKEFLNNAGIQYEILKSNVFVSDYSLVIPPDKPNESIISLDKLGDFTNLGNNLHLTDLSKSASMATAEQSGYLFRPLDENEVRFSFIPKTISTLVQSFDFPMDSLASLVSLDSIIAYNTRLEDFETRYIGSDSITFVRDWLVQKFSEFGYTDITTPNFIYQDNTYQNVMVVKLGYAEPDKVIVIGGHYDSITYGQLLGPLVYAPGSDDNASGTTVTLELARILADIPMRKTIIFMPFSAEEVGLVGSRAAARAFVKDSTNVEVMYNFDMVGFTDNSDAILDINLMSGSIDGYKQVSVDAANRVTSLVPVTVGLRGSSDHWAFQEQGFNICYAAEGDFNTLGWHTNQDLTSRMNFPYLTDVIKMSAAAIGIVGNSASPTTIESIADVGDGQSLEIKWDNCDPSYTYTIFYGTTDSDLSESVAVTSNDCSQIISGLDIGQRYYFSVVGTVVGGYPSVYNTVSNGTPYLIPRPPVNMNAYAELNSIRLTWQNNKENDFSHYRIYKNDGSQVRIFADNVTDLTIVDTNVVSQKKYTYHITAVDFDSYESNNSNFSSSYPATFDAGILLVDETGIASGLPNQEEQVAYFDSIFNGQPYDLHEMNSLSDKLQANSIGQYSSMFYFDDNSGSIILDNTLPLDWYATSPTNMLISGLMTVQYWAGFSEVNPTSTMFTEFGLESYEDHATLIDFAGATGENGFPSIQVEKFMQFPNLGFVPTLQPRPGAQVIYRYDSVDDNPDVEGKPCGIMYDSENGKRILLAFPLYYLTHESSQNIISHVISLFGETITQLPGDLDNSGELDIADLVSLVDYMFTNQNSPLDINTADVDGSCQIDIMDLVYFVGYIFGEPSGPAPVSGCVR